MKAEELLKRCEKEIHKLRIKNKGKFLKHGVKGEFEAIRDIVEFEQPKWDEREMFIEICDNRIDRLKSSTTGTVASLGAGIAAVVAAFLIKDYGTQLLLILGTFLLIFVSSLLLVLIFTFFYYRAQMYAWYAIKEGVLLVKKEKK